MKEPASAWSDLFRGLGAAPEPAAFVWTEIAAAYAEPWRRYHTMDHIAALLALRRAHATRFRDPITVDLAIFLHDVVYEPKRSDNEEKSAEWARGCLAVVGVAPARIAEVACYIELSKHDPAALAGVDPASDLAHFLDLDLSILAADAADYDAYARAIRQEYAIYPDAVYRQGRAKVLSGFLARPVIYCSAHFRAAWEARARANIAAEIGRLKT